MLLNQHKITMTAQWSMSFMEIIGFETHSIDICFIHHLTLQSHALSLAFYISNAWSRNDHSRFDRCYCVRNKIPHVQSNTKIYMYEMNKKSAVAERISVQLTIVRKILRYLNETFHSIHRCMQSPSMIYNDITSSLFTIPFYHRRWKMNHWAQCMRICVMQVVRTGKIIQTPQFIYWTGEIASGRLSRQFYYIIE